MVVKNEEGTEQGTCGRFPSHTSTEPISVLERLRTELGTDNSFGRPNKVDFATDSDQHVPGVVGANGLC